MKLISMHQLTGFESKDYVEKETERLSRLAELLNRADKFVSLEEMMRPYQELDKFAPLKVITEMALGFLSGPDIANNISQVIELVNGFCKVYDAPLIALKDHRSLFICIKGRDIDIYMQRVFSEPFCKFHLNASKADTLEV